MLSKAIQPVLEIDHRGDVDLAKGAKRSKLTSRRSLDQLQILHHGPHVSHDCRLAHRMTRGRCRSASSEILASSNTLPGPADEA